MLICHCFLLCSFYCLMHLYVHLHIIIMTHKDHDHTHVPVTFSILRKLWWCISNMYLITSGGLQSVWSMRLVFMSCSERVRWIHLSSSSVSGGLAQKITFTLQYHRLCLHVQTMSLWRGLTNPEWVQNWCYRYLQASRNRAKHSEVFSLHHT